SREGALPRARGPLGRSRHRRRPPRELTRARRDDRRDPEREQALQGARRHSPHGTSLSGELRIIPVTGLPEIEEGDDLAELIIAKLELEQGDVVVLAQK